MAKIGAETVKRWSGLAADWLATQGFTLEQVTVGRDAWRVAHGAGICNEAYADREIHDAHIQTALEQIFPNVKFMDKKRY